MALWKSLSEAEREGELELTPEEVEELDRRWMEHVQRHELPQFHGAMSAAG